MTGDDAFYLPLGDGRFRATGRTVGPWDPRAQHGGPPSALLARALEQAPGSLRGAPLARVTVEILAPIPAAEVEITTRVLRPGRRVELVEAELHAGGRAVALARGWRHVESDTTGVATAAASGAVPVPDGLADADVAPAWGEGYLQAMQWRFVRGGFWGEEEGGGETTPGRATVWARQRVALVAGEEPGGLQRVMTLADSGNGVSAVLDLRRWMFVNTDLTVHLVRPAVGEWLCLDAVTEIGSGGTGMATSRVSDREGPVARGAQALVVAPHRG